MLFSILKHGNIPYQDLHTYIDSGNALDSIDHLFLVAIMETQLTPLILSTSLATSTQKFHHFYWILLQQNPPYTILSRTMQGDNLNLSFVPLLHW